MTSFCVETIRPEPSLRAHHGILRAASFAVTTDARVVANGIVSSAREEANALLHAAHAEADRVAQVAEQQVFERAAQLLESLELMQTTLLERGQDLVVDLASNLFNRLVLQVTPHEKIQAALQRLLVEAPSKLVEPLLRVHPDDVALLPAVDWDIKPDAAMARGACRLEASDGQWCADFNGTVDALTAAFAKAVAAPVDIET